MIDGFIEHCYECQVTKQHNEEPIKSYVIPIRLWEEICTDFGGRGQYNLVAVDRQDKHPEVEELPQTQAKLNKYLATWHLSMCYYLEKTEVIKKTL